MARNLKKVENVKNRAKVKTEVVAILSIEVKTVRCSW